MDELCVLQDDVPPFADAQVWQNIKCSMAHYIEMWDAWTGAIPGRSINHDVDMTTKTRVPMCSAIVVSCMCFTWPLIARAIGAGEHEEVHAVDRFTHPSGNHAACLSIGIHTPTLKECLIQGVPIRIGLP